MPQKEATAKTTIFVGAILLLCVLSVAATITIAVARPDKDNTSVIAQIYAVVVPVITGLMACIIQQVHKAMNSRLTQLLALTQKSAKAEGVLEGARTASDLLSKTHETHE